MPRHQPRTDRSVEATRLRRLREFLNISQREMAREFQVAHTAISSWESGARTIPGPILRLMQIYEKESGLPEKAELTDLNSSWLSRNFKLSSAIAGMVTRMAGESFLRLMGAEPKPYTETAAIKLASTLGELKGLMMKAGQMISYTDFGLSESVREKFAILQDQSTALESSRIEAVIEQELGQSILQAFKSWDPNPIGNGSIGQVHAAQAKDGTELAVKVQFPEIERLMESDLQYTRFMDVLTPILFRKQDRQSLVQELRTRAKDECDYLREAESQKEFARIFSNDSNVIIPKVYDENSTARILCQERIHGKTFSEFVRTSSQEEKNQAGKILFRTVFQCIFRHGILNCDPQPGNYLFLDEKIAFLDFGCVKKLSPEFVSQWKEYLLAIMNDDRKNADQLIVAMGYVPNPKHFDFDFQFRMMKTIHAPWNAHQPFRFSREHVIESWNLTMQENINRSRMSLPGEWAFVNRLQWGLYSILAILGAENNYRELILDAGLTDC